MSIFKVGDRVRRLGATNTPAVIGRQATVIGDLELAVDGSGRKWIGHRICIDGIGPLKSADVEFCFRPEYLAPILPSPELSKMTYAELMLSFSGEVTA